MGHIPVGERRRGLQQREDTHSHYSRARGHPAPQMPVMEEWQQVLWGRVVKGPESSAEEFEV